MQRSQNDSRRWAFGSMLVLMAMAGVWVCGYANRFGADLEPDSDVYISAGVRLAHGQGVSFPNFLGAPDPMLVFPPMFPLQISLMERMHINPQLGIGRTHALCDGLLILFTAGLAWRVSRSGMLAVLAGWLVLTNPGILFVHTFAMSEPPFLIWVMTGLWCLSRWWITPRWRWIIVSGLCVAGAVMTRNAGAPLVPLGIAAVLLRGGVPLVRRVLGAVVFGTIAAGPLAFWSWIHQTHGGALAGRAVGWRGFTPHQLHDGAETLGSFVFPLDVPGQMAVVAAIVLVAFGCTVIALWTNGIGFREMRQRVKQLPVMVPLCLAFALAFTAFDIVAMETVGSGELDKRVLSVIVPPLVIVLAWWAGAMVQAMQQRAIRLTLGLGMVAVLGSYSWAAFQTVSQRSSEAALDWSPWRQSDTLGAIKELPPDALIYSNKPCCLFMACRRLNEGIPAPNDAGEPDDSEIQEMREQLHDRGGWIVYWDAVDGGDEPHLDEAAIRKLFPIAQTQRFDDGVILRIDPPEDAAANLGIQCKPWCNPNG